MINIVLASILKHEHMLILNEGYFLVTKSLGKFYFKQLRQERQTKLTAKNYYYYYIIL